MNKINWHALRMTDSNLLSKHVNMSDIVIRHTPITSSLTIALDEILSEQKTSCIPIIVNNDIEHWHKTGEEK